MAPSAATVAVLDEDLLQEVFILLPSPADIVRTALACKPFLGAIRSAVFLRRFRRRHPSACPPLLGCFVIGSSAERSRDRVPFLLPHPAVPAATRRAARHGDFALSFLPRGGWLDGAQWRVLGCHNGQLLLGNQVSAELAVADPLTRRCVSLPPPPTGQPLGYGFITDDGDSSAFQAVCIARDEESSGLHALLLSSNQLCWADVAGPGIANQPNIVNPRAMQANRTLYWTLEGRESMVALNTVSMEFRVLQLPSFLRELCFELLEKGDDSSSSGLYLLTMRGFCIEVWVGAEDEAGALTWMMVEKSVRFYKVMEQMCGSSQLLQHGLDVLGVVAGVLFVRNADCLLSIDLETMKLEKFSEQDYSSLQLVYPYAIAWPPSFLNPTKQGI